MDESELKNGVAIDPRSEEEKAQDYSHEDLAMGEVELFWAPLSEKIYPDYPISNQDGSLSCVAHAVAKILAMHEVKEGRKFTQLCPKFIYDWRENYPSGGMWLPNALSIACKYGSCEESRLDCDMKGETYMNDKSLITEDMINNALNYKGLYYFEIKNRTMDEIAKVIEQGYGVLAGFHFDRDEWTDVPFVKDGSGLEVGHGVALLRYGLHEEGKAFGMDDSWGVKYGKGGKRIITEDFLYNRCFYCGYVTSLPNFKFTKTLRFGSRGIDVRKLQETLNKTGYILKVDGIFGRITQFAVEKFQKSKGLVADGIVGIRTNRALNQI